MKYDDLWKLIEEQEDLLETYKYRIYQVDQILNETMMHDYDPIDLLKRIAKVIEPPINK